MDPHPPRRRAHRLAVLAAALVSTAAPAWADDPLPGESPPEAAEPSPARRRLGLAELVKLARERSPIVANARSQIDIRKAQRREALWNAFPTGDVTFGMTLVPRVTCIGPNNMDGTLTTAELLAKPLSYRQQNCVNTVDPTTGSEKSPNQGFGAFYNTAPAGDISARLTQPLFTFGKIYYGWKAGDAGVLAEEARTEAARGDAELQTVRAYWGLKAARTSLVTAGEVRTLVVKWLDKIEADIDSDHPKLNFSQSDVSRIKVALVGVDIVIADLERNVSIAENGLRLAVASDVDVDEEEIDPVEVIEQPLDYYQLQAVLHRPEVQALDAGSRAYRYLAKLQLAYMAPNIGVNLNIGQRWAEGTDDPTNGFLNRANQTYYGGSIGVQLPLDLFVRYARFSKARSEADAFDAQRRLAMAGISFEIVQAWSNLEEARKRLRLLDRSQRVAQGWLNAIDQKLDLGVGDPSAIAREFVEAARTHFDARLRFYQAINDVNYGVAVLRRATGVEVAR